MNFFESFIEKVANDFDRQKELDLIKRVQKNENDVAAWQQLRIRFKPLISMAIRNARMGAANLPQDIFDAAAMEEFKRTILKFDPSSGYQPSTYISRNIQLSLQKLKDQSMNETRFQGGLVTNSKYIHNARELLSRELDREPTNKELQEGAKKLFGKNIPIKEIERIDNYTRSELSLNKSLGEDGTGENITFGDIFNTSSATGEDLWQAHSEKTKVEKALQKLNPKERRIFMEWKGLGEFVNRKAPSLAALALNNNLGSAWQAQKIVREIQNKLERELR